MIIVSGMFISWVIIVDRVPECIVYELYDVRVIPKGNLISRASPICMFSHTNRGINPNQRGCCHTVNSPKEVIISVEHLVIPVPPYAIGRGREIIGGIIPSDSWAVHLGKL